MKIPLEDTFNGAKNAFILLDAFIGTVVKEIGEEKAYNMIEETCQTMGALQGKMSRSQARREKIKEMNPKNASFLASGAIKGFGIDTEILKESEEKVSIKVGKCPVYEAAKMMGLDPEPFCRRSAIPFMNSLVKELSPNLQYELEKFRTGQDDFCEESIALIK
ncbi:MAG: L-2-amino-thiazoline-4-carboxylic acid hydrolase [Promethearchaeota archaeon]